MKKFISNQVIRLVSWLNYGQTPLLLLLRLWIATLFFRSGYLKISNFDNAISLFTYEHPVPLLPPLVAAILGTFFELVCSSMLILGIGTRLATLPLIAMTLVIEFTYMDVVEHYYWLMVLGTILFFGPGAISVDRLLYRKYGD